MRGQQTLLVVGVFHFHIVNNYCSYLLSVEAQVTVVAFLTERVFEFLQS